MENLKRRKKMTKEEIIKAIEAIEEKIDNFTNDEEWRQNVSEASAMLYNLKRSLKLNGVVNS